VVRGTSLPLRTALETGRRIRELGTVVVLVEDAPSDRLEEAPALLGPAGGWRRMYSPPEIRCGASEALTPASDCSRI
jgi:hypothetical protein